MANEIPYKIYLSESEMPDSWYNVRADMKNKPAPLINPVTHKPSTLEELSQVFCTELAKQELNETDRYIKIPKEILDFYKSITKLNSLLFSRLLLTSAVLKELYLHQKVLMQLR